MTFDPEPVAELPFDGDRTLVFPTVLSARIAELILRCRVLRIIFKVRAHYWRLILLHV